MPKGKDDRDVYSVPDMVDMPGIGMTGSVAFGLEHDRLGIPIEMGDD